MIIRNLKWIVRSKLRWVVRSIKSISKKKKKTTTMEMHIPDDIIVEILLKLPAKSLSRFKLVCKYWFNVIRDPNFVNMHVNNNVKSTNDPLVLVSRCSRPSEPPFIELYSLNSMDHDVLHPVDFKVPVSVFTVPEDYYFQVLGSCNGLLCIGIMSIFMSGGEKFYIWNPCTKEYKRIKWRDDSVTVPNRSFITYGFGYDCTIDDYKVIRNICIYTADGETFVDVYTVGTNSSKKLRSNGFFFYRTNTSGLYINGDLYWIAKVKSLELNNKIIVAFDIAKEKYRQIAKLPYMNYDESYYSVNLGNLNGCLCVLNITANKQSVEVWMMRHNGDDTKEEYSWDILYKISEPRYRDFWHIKPICLCKNGEIAIVMNMTDFTLYNPKNNQLRFLPKGGEVSTVETYIESLVPIKGGTNYIRREFAMLSYAAAYKLF